MVSRPTLVEKDYEKGKYYLNFFYQLEEFSPELHMETESINIDGVKGAAMDIIDRDKKRFKEPDCDVGKDKKEVKPAKSTIYEKLEWMEDYILGRFNRLRPDKVVGAFSSIITDE